MSDCFCTLLGLLAHSWFEIMEFSVFLIIVLSGTGKWLHSESGQISGKRQYFKITCVEPNLIFYRKETWSFLKVLDYQILEESINLRL